MGGLAGGLNLEWMGVKDDVEEVVEDEEEDDMSE